MTFSNQNWFKIKSFIILVVICATFSVAHASTIDCSQIDGSSIYGYEPSFSNGSDWTYIGSISSEYDVNSIANPYGEYGNKYNSNSIFDQYGTFGSRYNSYSAFNKYALNPPVLVTPNGSWAYLTVNKYVNPQINPYFALFCAQQSYTISDGN